MKKIITNCLIMGLLLIVSQGISQTNNTATDYHMWLGYGTHGVVFGLDGRVGTSPSDKFGTRLYLDVGGQLYSFDDPIKFKDVYYNSDTRIISWGAGLAIEYYLTPDIHLAPFLGIRFESSHFTDSYINEQIGDGELIRYLNDEEVGSRLDKDYGNSKMALDIGCGLNLRITNHIWLIGKVGYAPIKYDSNQSMYGEYWADTPVENNFYIQRSPFRAEVNFCFGF